MHLAGLLKLDTLPPFLYYELLLFINRLVKFGMSHDYGLLCRLMDRYLVVIVFLRSVVTLLSSGNGNAFSY